MPDKPFAMIFAAFADPASFKRVPTTGIELAVPAPSYKPKPGGVGWDDIEGLLSEADRDPDYDRKHSFPLSDRGSEVQKHIFVRISAASTCPVSPTSNWQLTFVTLSEKEITSNPLPVEEVPTPEMQRQVAEKFLQWAETNKPLRPISSTHPITERELFGISELDNVRLRAAMRWVGLALGKRTPFETYPQSDEAPGVEPGGTPSGQASGEESETYNQDSMPIQSSIDK